MELLIAPPPAAAIASMAQIPRLSISPSILVTQQGPGDDGRAGPEAAGAVLLLQATFATAEGAEQFWAAAVPLMELLAEAPGFIRRFSFPDGPTVNLLALWRTVEDAEAFGRSPAHRDAVAGLYRGGWQHTHFSAVWALHHGHDRIAFCPCGTATPVSRGACADCEAPLFDLYATPPS